MIGDGKGFLHCCRRTSLLAQVSDSFFFSLITYHLSPITDLFVSETIVALSTPIGRSGIAVIRLSGIRALEITRELTRDRKFKPQPRFATVKEIFDIESHELLDEVVVTYFQSPNSFTGEDVVEISSHGSPVLIRQIIDLCLKLDARLAEAGEFTLRALSHGKINLTQAEAIRDLIDAQTNASARQAVRQLRGELSNSLQPLKLELLDVIVLLESSLEFVEDNLPDVETENVKEKLREIATQIEKLAATFRAGKLLREGLRVTIAGRPNVGKSSLFNALLGSERAIVTDIAGTTRDSLHERITIKNIPVSLTDTAGLHEATDVVETLGVARAKRAMADSDLVIVVLDASAEITREDEEVLRESSELETVIAINKIDLCSNGSSARDSIKNQFANSKSKVVDISAIAGTGLEDLKRAIVEPFSTDNDFTGGFLVSDARHHDLLLRAKSEIENSLESLDEKKSEEIVLIGLHNAMRLLGQITGETTTEDILTRIFATFCIGK